MDGADKVALVAALERVTEHWRPRIIGEVNGSKIQLASSKATSFGIATTTQTTSLVLHGRLAIDLPEKTIDLQPGELLIVPRGLQHRPRAVEEVHVLNIELKGTVNTGDAHAAGELTAPERYL